MNKDIAKGNFTQLKGKLKQKWGQLTDDEIDEMRAMPKFSLASCRSATVWHATMPNDRRRTFAKRITGTRQLHRASHGRDARGEVPPQGQRCRVRQRTDGRHL